MNELGYILEQDIIMVLSASTLNELTGGRRAIGSNPAIEGEEEQWKRYLPATVETIAGYIRHWYDANTELRPIFLYSSTDAFTQGNRVASNPVNEGDDRILYVCIQDAPAGTVLTNIAFFTEEDDRNAVLVEIAALLLVYNASRRINPQQVPEQRVLDYDNSIAKLKDIQRGKIQLSITERSGVETDDAGQEFAWGDFEGISHDIY